MPTTRELSEAIATVGAALRELSLETLPGIASIGVRTSLPCTRNIGSTMSAASSRVSRTSDRSGAVRRKRRRRVAGKVLTTRAIFACPPALPARRPP